MASDYVSKNTIIAECMVHIGLLIAKEGRDVFVPKGYKIRHSERTPDGQ
jgi:hypothetical protein